MERHARQAMKHGWGGRAHGALSQQESGRGWLLVPTGERQLLLVFFSGGADPDGVVV